MNNKLYHGTVVYYALAIGKEGKIMPQFGRKGGEPAIWFYDQLFPAQYWAYEKATMHTLENEAQIPNWQRLPVIFTVPTINGLIEEKTPSQPWEGSSKRFKITRDIPLDERIEIEIDSLSIEDDFETAKAKIRELYAKYKTPIRSE